MKYTPYFVLSLVLCLPVTVCADSIILASDPWCPYNCTPDSAQKGYMIDIARAVFEKAGHTVEYKTTNWARAVTDARAGKITGVVGAHREDAQGFVFPSQSQGSVQYHFYVTKNQPWRYSNIASLDNIKIAVINDYAYDTDINTFIANGIGNQSNHIHVASGEHALENNIHMVIQKRVDTLIENKDVFVLTASKMKVLDQFIDAGSSGIEHPVYIAFSPTHPKAQQYADILSDGMITLRKNGELQKILSAYGIHDWKAN